MPTIGDVAKGIGGLFGGKKKGSFALTPAGKNKADSWSTDDNSYRYDILVYLDDNSPATVREIAEHLHAPEKTVQHILDNFEDDGWVTKK